MNTKTLRLICCLLVLCMFGSGFAAANADKAAVIDYHRCPAIMSDTYGERVVNMTCEIIDAFLAGESGVILHGYEDGDLTKILRCAGSVCPLFVAFTYFDGDCFDERTHRLSWVNFLSDDELAEKQQLLEDAVSAFLQGTEPGDGDLLKAADIYYRYAAVNTYNDAMNEEGAFDSCSLEELMYTGSPYQAIVEHTAICYGLSDGLAFLYIQAGLNAVTVGSFFSGTGDPSHDWVMVQLDGSWYYVDPTWDLPFGGDYPGLLYFGMTADDRCEAGGYPIEYTELYGNDDSFDMTAYGLDSMRFSILRDECFRQVQSLTPDRDRQCLIVTAADGNIYEIR